MSELLAETKGKPGCLGRLLKVSGVLLGFVLVLAGGWSCRIHRKRSAALQHLDELIAEWEKGRPAVPEKYNAARFYRQAAGCLSGKIDREALEKSFRSPGAKASPEIETLLASSALALAHMQEALALEKCQFVSGSFEDVFSQVSREPKLVRIVELAHIMGARGRRKALGGDVSGGLDDILSRLRLAEHLSQQAGLIDNMIAAAIQEHVSEDLEILVSHHLLDEQQCRQAMTAIDAHLGRMTAPGEILRGEKLTMMSMATRVACGQRGHSELSRKGKPPGGPGSVLDSLGIYWQWSGASFEDADHLEDALDRMIAAVDMPPEECVRSFEAISAEVRAVAMSSRIGGDRFFYSITMPSLIVVAKGLRCGESEMLVCRTGLACELYRLRSGKYPEGLGALKEPTRDPHRTGPLSYEQKDTGFKVWGIGPDYEDNKGTHPDDQVFEVGAKK